MRYAVLSDIHANLEALEAVLAKIDELAQEEPVDQICFLGDLVGYGPNPNECIVKLRERTDVIIAGNHDWAAIGKIDLEDFSEAARISAEWTARQLTEEHRQFLTDLPERLTIGECTLVHGSPYGPLWEYLTSEILAERSFQHFTSRYCLVGHTHVPLIYQQQDSIATAPTTPLENSDQSRAAPPSSPINKHDPDEDKTIEMATVCPTLQISQEELASSYAAKESVEERSIIAEEEPDPEGDKIDHPVEPVDEEEISKPEEATPEDIITHAEDRLNQEIEELLALLGLSQSLIQVTNEMISPPEGDWQAPEGYRAIINPGGVGQPRDGNPRAAFMIYDTERGFTFYRIPYNIEKTQEKIVKAGLPQYLATRLAYGR
jgi:diadenosine tetraphosphatase ApaH/serine/threonine PP2A family protein phosphatase